ncbi:MAG: glycosyl hydrolase 108 family protein, partial [Pseudomonadales bacterium]
ETKYGISKRSYPHLDIKNLTVEEAKAIYLKDFWEKLGCHQLADEIAIELFDTSVNMGTYRGAMIFQDALNLTNRNERDYSNIKLDGDIGPATIRAYHSNQVGSKVLFNVMNILQGEFYIGLMRRREVMEKYIGWFNRVEIKKT